uniref:Uncharacterized protein n=1 Tax=Oryza sativa subsp. japonica TaxID=39947 RepID=Q65X61_ORYSJ|nr:hypothetical protein [Oryza sativa Japonica Group]
MYGPINADTIMFAEFSYGAHILHVTLNPIYCRGSDWRGTSKQFNKDDVTTYNISCFLLLIYDIQMLIKSIVWQELSSHHGVLQCQMADVQKLLRFSSRMRHINR